MRAVNRSAFAILAITAMYLAAVAIVLTLGEGGQENARDMVEHHETDGSIGDSSVHDYRIFIPAGSGRAKEASVETEGEEVGDDISRGLDSSADSSDSDVPVEPDGQRLTREVIIDYARENYGVSEEWVVWLIGTTWREDYHDDRYLEYAWACEIINCYRYWSVYDLDCIWGIYYSVGNAYGGYYSADAKCLEMVWLALTDPDPRIVEVDGMIEWYVPGYYLIYDSLVYDCQVWGR